MPAHSVLLALSSVLVLVFLFVLGGGLVGCSKAGGTNDDGGDGAGGENTPP
jgi:hypothetical protein